MRRGFTLVEVLVALVVLEVGLLGVVGTLLLALRTLQEAQTLEGAAAAIEWAYEGLLSGRAAGSGRVTVPGGEVHWESFGDESVRVEFEPTTALTPVAVFGALPSGPPR